MVNNVLTELVEVQATAWCGSVFVEPERDVIDFVQAPATDRIQRHNAGSEFVSFATLRDGQCVGSMAHQVQ
jgi:hypothetical protein